MLSDQKDRECVVPPPMLQAVVTTEMGLIVLMVWSARTAGMLKKIACSAVALVVTCLPSVGEGACWPCLYLVVCVGVATMTFAGWQQRSVPRRGSRTAVG